MNNNNKNMLLNKNKNMLVFSIIEERALKTLPDNQTIRNHTRMIALQSKVPFMYTTCGAYINDKCHIHESYAENHFIEIINL